MTIQDYEEIRKVAQLYIDGSNGNSAIMKPAFHKNATINSDPIQTLFDTVDKLGKTSARAIVDVLDAINDIAVVRITMEDWHGQNFVDYHLLRKDETGWKIIAKSFTEIK